MPRNKPLTPDCRRRCRVWPAGLLLFMALSLVNAKTPLPALGQDSTITAGQDSVKAGARLDSSLAGPALADSLVSAPRVDSTFSAARFDTVSSAASLIPPRVISYKPAFACSDFDTVTKDQYLLAHSFTLDHFMETVPGFVLTRSGPIGKSAALSRYGFGRGRGTVYLGGVPINDPQNDIAPLVHFPVSGIGTLVTGREFAGHTLAPDGLEGYVNIIETPPPEDRPSTFLEVSKGTNNLRQRRVRFSSAQSAVGVDLGYDESLNDGYSFDARQLGGAYFTRGAGFGKSLSRHYTMNLRGDLPGDERYLLSFRKFTSNSDGDIVSTDLEQRLSGHLASINTELRGFRLTFFERGYKATFPDSQSVNQTTGGYADWVTGFEDKQFTVGGGFEDIVATMKVGGAESRPRLRKSTARITASSELGPETVGRVQISGTDYHGLTTGWGGSLSISRRFGRQSADLDLRRGYRMPNLAELYLPARVTGVGTAVGSGNKYVESEKAWEAAGRVALRYGPVTSETRMTAVQADNPIVFARGGGNGSGGGLIASNGRRERLAVVEERIRLDTSYRGFEINLFGSASRAGGDRDAYFASVPLMTVVTSARVGGSMFEASSALHLGVEYVYRSSRRGFGGGLLPSYNVFNFRLDGRLLDANMYLCFLNAFNEYYETANGYLMTPRTFVYGLTWTIFE